MLAHSSTENDAARCRGRSYVHVPIGMLPFEEKDDTSNEEEQRKDSVDALFGVALRGTFGGHLPAVLSGDCHGTALKRFLSRVWTWHRHTVHKLRQKRKYCIM